LLSEMACIFDASQLRIVNCKFYANGWW